MVWRGGYTLTPPLEYRLLGKVFYRFTTRYKAWVAILASSTKTKHKGICCIFKIFLSEAKLKLNSVVLTRKRTIPTERPQHVGEVSANFS
jgi:hypothetical protein